MAYLSLLFFGFYEKKNGRKGILRRERVFLRRSSRKDAGSRSFFLEVLTETRRHRVFIKNLSNAWRLSAITDSPAKQASVWVSGFRGSFLRRERVFFEEKFAQKRRVAKFFLRSSHGDTEPQSFY